MTFRRFIDSKSFQTRFSVFRDLIVILGVIASVISLFDVARQTGFAAQQTALNTVQIKEYKEVASAQFIDTINQRENSSKYDKIANAIEGNDNTVPNTAKIWDQEGGKFSDSDIGDYIDNFDEIGNLYSAGLIDKKMAYNEFSYDAEKAWCNNSIRDMINNARKSDGSYKYHDYREDWWGFQQLATMSLKIDNEKCSALNDE